MPSILIAYSVDYTSLILTAKLRGDVDNDVTFFKNAFTTNAVPDLQSMSSDKINTTCSKVNINLTLI